MTLSYGPGSKALRSFTIVARDGDVLTISESSEPDTVIVVGKDSGSGSELRLSQEQWSILMDLKNDVRFEEEQEKTDGVAAS